MLNYLYVDLLSQRIFRVTFYDHRFVQPVLDGVLGMVSGANLGMSESNLSWSKYKGIYNSGEAPSILEQSRLDTLAVRCEALEMLYKIIYLLRKPYAEVSPLETEIFQLKLREAKALLAGGAETEYLSDYARINEMDIQQAAQKMVFLEKDRLALLRQSELLKLEWERNFIRSENPKQQLDQFRTTVYLG